MGSDRADRCLVRATATRWLADDPLPGLVELQFAEHDATVVTIHEKPPVVDVLLDRDTSYPVEVLLDAEIVAAGASAWFVRLLHSVEDLTGRTEFTVGPELIRRTSMDQERRWTAQLP